MTAALLREPALDVQLMPVTILWGRSPGSQDSLVKALFADAWASVGPLRQVLIILLHGRQTRVSFGEPISLRRLIDERGRRSHGGAQGQSLPALPLSPDARVGDRPGPVAPAQPDPGDGGLGRPAGGHRGGRGAARHEHGGDRGSGAQVRVGDRVGLQLSGRARDGAAARRDCGGASTTESRSITANELAKAAPGKGLVYLPNHRSHVDYLLLSYLVHAQGLAPPHIAAGANLNFPVVGPLLRRGGAFFLRRSFKGEPLYAAVFREYLHAMLAKGFPIAYFIEGGRSRSGRTLAPKGGLLGMTVESFMREHPRPLLLVPVYFSYEKLLEGRTLVAELEGQPKEGESLGALVRVARNLRREYGSVHVNFGAPLSIDQFLDREAPDWHALQGDEQRDAARRLTPLLGREMAQRINVGGRHQSDQSVRHGHRAQSAPGARRARARAADRLAEDDRVPAALLAGRRAHRP